MKLGLSLGLTKRLNLLLLNICNSINLAMRDVWIKSLVTARHLQLVHNVETKY